MIVFGFLSIWKAALYVLTVILCHLARGCSSKIDNCPLIIRRSEWDARPAKSITYFSDAVSYVFMYHSVSPVCEDDRSCKDRIREFQRYHMNDNHWDDIGYTFLVGGDGSIYEGRGWNRVGAHTKGFNADSYGFCVIGDFRTAKPTDAQIVSVKALLDCGMSLGKIKSDYALRGNEFIVSAMLKLFVEDGGKSKRETISPYHQDPSSSKISVEHNDDDYDNTSFADLVISLIIHVVIFMCSVFITQSLEKKNMPNVVNVENEPNLLLYKYNQKSGISVDTSAVCEDVVPKTQSAGNEHLPSHDLLLLQNSTSPITHQSNVAVPSNVGNNTFVTQKIYVNTLNVERPPSLRVDFTNEANIGHTAGVVIGTNRKNTNFETTEKVTIGTNVNDTHFEKTDAVGMTGASIHINKIFKDLSSDDESQNSSSDDKEM